jgi:anti-anti-sigma factor
MSNAPANLSVSVGDHLVCIRVVGRASFHCSVDFKTLVCRLWQQGQTRFILDLTECHLMDSTFLGVLAGLGLRFGEERNAHGPAHIELLNPSSRIADLLENLGIAHLFRVFRGAAPTDGPLRPVDSPAGNPDRQEVSRTCLEAHKLLMDLHPANIPKFKDVTKFLEEDLKKTGE